MFIYIAPNLLSYKLNDSTSWQWQAFFIITVFKNIIFSNILKWDWKEHPLRSQNPSEKSVKDFWLHISSAVSISLSKQAGKATFRPLWSCRLSASLTCSMCRWSSRRLWSPCTCPLPEWAWTNPCSDTTLTESCQHKPPHWKIIIYMYTEFLLCMVQWFIQVYYYYALTIDKWHFKHLEVNILIVTMKWRASFCSLGDRKTLRNIYYEYWINRQERSLYSTFMKSINIIILYQISSRSKENGFEKKREAL